MNLYKKINFINYLCKMKSENFIFLCITLYFAILINVITISEIVITIIIMKLQLYNKILFKILTIKQIFFYN